MTILYICKDLETKSLARTMKYLLPAQDSFNRLVDSGKVVAGEVRIVVYVEVIPFMKIERRAGSKDHNKPTDT